MTERVRCMVCGRPQNEVKLLLQLTETAQLCNKCMTSGFRTMTEALNREAAEAEKEAPLKKPPEVKAFLDTYVVGQEKAKKDIAIAVYNHFKRREALKLGHITIDVDGQEEEVEIDKSNIILLGPSGTGKTHIARAVARMLKVPFYVADATKLTSAGYVGDDVESLLQGLIAAADGDVERAEWGICFIDEFDKIARKSGHSVSGYRDVTGEGVQQGLLKLLEGARVAVPRGMGAKAMISGGPPADMIDTTNILFIGAGSFAGIEEVVERRVNKHSGLGFGAETRTKFDKNDRTSVYLQVIEEDILEFGMIPELVGRMPVQTTTLDLTEDQMVEVLTRPKNAIIKQFRALFKMDNIDLQFDEDALRAIAREAKTRPTNARALRGIVESVVQPYGYDAPSRGDVAAIRITKDTVEKKAAAVIVTRDLPAFRQG